MCTRCSWLAHSAYSAHQGTNCEPWAWALTRCRWRWKALMHFSFWSEIRCDVTQTSRLTNKKKYEYNFCLEISNLSSSSSSKKIAEKKVIQCNARKHEIRWWNKRLRIIAAHNVCMLTIVLILSYFFLVFTAYFEGRKKVIILCILNVRCVSVHKHLAEPNVCVKVIARQPEIKKSRI